MRKDSKMVGKAKENVKPSVTNRNKSLAKRKKELTKPSCKIVLQSKKCKKNTISTCTRYTKKKVQGKVNQVAVKNTILKKVPTRKMSKTTECEKKMCEKQFQHLKQEMQESMRNVPLTNTELATLVAKYKRDGHYRVDPNLPPITTLFDTLQTQSNTKCNTYNSSTSYNFSVNQPTFPDFVSSPETYSSTSQNENEYSYAQTNNFLKDASLGFSSYSNFNMNNQNDKLYNAYSSIKKNQEYAFDNSYSMNYNNNNNNIYTTSCISDIANNNTQAFTQFYQDRQNPYCLSNIVNYHNNYDTNVPPNEPAAVELLSYNMMPNIEHNSADNTSICSVVRNHSFAQSDAVSSSPLDDRNISSPDMYNYQAITKNDSEALYLRSFSQQDEAILPDISNTFYTPEIENTIYDFPRENNTYGPTRVMPMFDGENFTCETNEFSTLFSNGVCGST